VRSTRSWYSVSTVRIRLAVVAVDDAVVGLGPPTSFIGDAEISESTNANGQSNVSSSVIGIILTIISSWVFVTRCRIQCKRNESVSVPKGRFPLPEFTARVHGPRTRP